MLERPIAMKDKNLLIKIENGINNLDIFDTHKNLIYQIGGRKKKLDFYSLFLSHYSSTDQISSGLILKEYKFSLDLTKDQEKKWITFFNPGTMLKIPLIQE